jgi:hypothetical protein
VIATRPTLSEQLTGLRHILEHAVAPDVQSEYAQETLLGVIRALEMLARRIGEVGPFLEWDNGETRALLRTIAARLPLDQPLEPDAPITPGDLAALDAENERLRTMLATAIPALSADAGARDVHAAVVAHLRERIARYPYASTGTLPAR